jgi:hypothetical protein
MKQTIFIIIVGLFALLLAASSVSAVTWLTYREDVSFSVGTVDFDIVYYHNGTTTEVYRNITLPCNIENLTSVVWNITGDGGAAYFNLSVNGVMCNTTGNYTDGVSNLTTLAQMETAGVDNTSEYLNFTFNASAATNDIAITVTANDATFSTTWLSGNIVVKECDVTSPKVKPELSKSYWVVNDSINISSTIGYTLTDLNLTTVYPGHYISNPDTYIRVASLANGSYNSNYTVYQKRGPYVYSVDDDIDGTKHKVTILIKAEELLTNCADWELEGTDSVYDGAFDTLDYTTLDVEVNGVDVDWDEGSIDMDDLTIRSVHSLNKFTFEWTAVGVTPTPAPSVLPGWTDVYILPLWLWAVIITAGSVAVVVAIVAYKKPS